MHPAPLLTHHALSLPLCAPRLPVERTLRVQEQSISLKRFGEDLMTIQQRIDAEKLSRWAGGCLGSACGVLPAWALTGIEVGWQGRMRARCEELLLSPLHATKGEESPA